MSGNPIEPEETAQVRTIRQLVRLMQRFDLTAIDLIEGDAQIRLRRRGAEAPAPVAPVAAPALGASAAPVPTPTPEPVAGTMIESPMVGTFYASGSPDAPPFVSSGTKVRPDTTVCVIEAMKVFTDIPAGVSGTITEVLVKNGQSVEFGQPMFRLTED